MTTSKHPGPRQQELQRRGDSVLDEQSRLYGDWPRTDRELELIDRAGAAVDAAVQVGNPQAFDAAIEIWLRRTTPIQVLVDHIGEGSGREEIARWVQVYAEAAERGLYPSRLVVSGCQGLGGRDLVLVVAGDGVGGQADPVKGEFALADLPVLVEVAEASARAGKHPVLPEELVHVGKLRGAFGCDLRFVEGAGA